MSVDPLSSAVTVHTTSPSRKRPQETESDKPIIDFGLISAALCAQFEETPLGSRFEERTAENLCILNPDVPLQFSVYRPSKINQCFKDYLETSAYSKKEQKPILRAVHHLCNISLLNSKYQETLVTLEENLPQFMAASTKAHFTAIIVSARQLATAPVGRSLSDLEARAMALNQLSANIDQALGLFYYAADDVQECVNILATETIISYGTPRYPYCQQHFKEFCAKLKILTHEHSALNELRTQILRQKQTIQSQIQSLCKELERKEVKVPTATMIPEREQFYGEEMGIIWTTGSELLKHAFLNTLQSKEIPGKFAEAIDQSADMSPDWTSLHFEELLEKEEFPKFEEGFIGNVWGTYTKDIDHLTDLGDFMRHFINALPNRPFQKLKASSTKSKALKEAFLSYFSKRVTFKTLKTWALKQKPLK